jgi:excisionase family DNA binding protein
MSGQNVPAPESVGWLDVKGAAAYLSVGRSAIYHAITNAGLPAHRTPTNRLLFKREELDAWVMRGASS